MTPAVSIIMPCYNAERFLEEAIVSVLTQQGPSLELILIDDGSTDDTQSIIAKAAARDPRIIAIAQANAGVSAARNAGIQRATGHYIGFLDSDDLFLPDKLARQVEFLNANPQYVVAAGAYERVDASLRRIFVEQKPSGPVTPEELLMANSALIITVLMTRAIAERVGPWDTTMTAGEDWDYLCRVALEGGRVYRDNAIVSQYRVVAGSLTSKAGRMTEASLRVIEKTFTSPKMKDEWRPLKSKAEFATRMNGAGRALAAGDVDEARKQLTEIEKLDPSIFTTGRIRIARKIAGWLLITKVSPDADFLAQVSSALPPGVDKKEFEAAMRYALERQRLVGKKRAEGLISIVLPALALFLGSPILAIADAMDSFRKPKS